MTRKPDNPVWAAMGCMGLILAVACGSANTSEGGGGITVGATSQASQYANRLVGGYRNMHPGSVNPSVQVLPEIELWEALDEGTVQAVIYLEDAAPEEYWTAPLGWTAIAFAVHPANPVRHLTREEVRDIYQGRLAQWSDLGGRASEIQRYTYVNGSDMQRLFEKFVLDGGRPAPDVFAAPGAWAMRLVLEEEEDALVYMICIDVGEDGIPLSINGVSPTFRAAQEGAYPFSIPVLLSAAKHHEEEVEQFAEWIQSDSGQIHFRKDCEEKEE